MNFFKSLMASMLGTLLAMAFIILVFVLMIVGSIMGSEGKVKVKESSVLHLKLDGLISERANPHSGGFSSQLLSEEASYGLDELQEVLKRASKDSKISGLFLEMGGVVAAPSTMLDLHRAIKEFRESGKWVIAYAEEYKQGAYFLASASSDIYLYPTGVFDWRGVNAEIMFFKRLLDKLEIEAQIIRGPNNKFKSAVEPFMYEQMSDANRKQIETFIGDVWNVMLEGISSNRGMSTADLNMYADSLLTVHPEKTVELHLVDSLLYRDQVIAQIATKLGLPADTKEDDSHFVDFDEYARSESDEDVEESDNNVAVVYAVGDITSGEGDDATIGSDRIAAALRKAREDKDVKAIVLRVNSPGGSALASDVIWRETELIRASGKPFYVSMGDYAASGGYYISCSAERIFANANTITGSIGVFGIIPNMQKFWENKIGITYDRYETNPHADLISLNKPLDPKEAKAMQDMVTQIYTDFITKVSKGRNITVEMVDSIGQGRVWSGEDALAIGLVDEIGNLDDCVKAVASKAGLSDYEIVEYPEMIDPFKKFVEGLGGKKEAQILQEILGEEYTKLEELKRITRMEKIQARLPFFMEIR